MEKWRRGEVIGFVSRFLVFHRSDAAEIGFVSRFSHVGRVAIGFVWGNGGTGCRARTRIGFPDESGLTCGQRGKMVAGRKSEMLGSKREAAVWWALVCNSSCLKGCVQLGDIIPENLLFIKQIPGLSADFADFRRLFAAKREKMRGNRRMSN